MRLFELPEQDPNASPFNAVPPVVVLMALAMALIEGALALGQAGLAGGPQAVGWRIAAIERLAFSGPLLRWQIEDPARLLSPELARFLTYPFVHGGFMHMGFAAVILLALGKFAGEVFRAPALLAIWAGSAIAGALVYTFALPTPVPLYGGMPPAYGLVGAFTFLLWQRAKLLGTNPWPAFRLIGVLIGFQLFFLALQPAGAPQVLAELGGFAAGFALALLLAPGAVRRLRARMQQR